MFKHDYLDGPQQLEELLAQAAIAASLFLPFTIFRLRPYAVDHHVALTVALYEAGSETPQTHQLQLTWHPGSDTLVMPPIQAHILTEWAACGLALAFIVLSG